MTKIIAVVNLKGGTGKTTTTAHLAHAYRKLGLNVVVVDADNQKSTSEWSEEAEWEIPVFSKAAPKLHMLLPGIIGDRFDVVIIDTPGRQDGNGTETPEDQKVRGIVYGAIRAADFVLIPVAPTKMEVKKLASTYEVIEDAASVRDEPLPYAVLFNRTVYNAGSTKIWEDAITSLGHRVLTTKIGRKEDLAQSLGFPVTDLFDHDQVVIEMEKVEAAMKAGN